jgi:N-methylhydantoinase A/oxoprolinase/acetone carboxylase beta subunit
MTLHSTEHGEWKAYDYGCTPCSISDSAVHLIAVYRTWKVEKVCVHSYSVHHVGYGMYWCVCTHQRDNETKRPEDEEFF